LAVLAIGVSIVQPISFGELIDSPRKQMERGIPADQVICKSSLVLIIRNTGSAACTKPSTADILENSGWGIKAIIKAIPETQNPRPNIIVIMTDDLDLNSFNLLLSENMLPNIQNYLITNGTIFTNNFVTTSNCCPSRATFFTGLYVHNHQVYTNVPKLNGSIAAFDDSSTLAVWLNTGDYRTGLIGKYLNGYGIFTEPSYIPPGWDDWKALIEKFTWRMYNYRINNNGNILDFDNHTSDYQTDVLASYASEFIEKPELNKANQSFFLLLSPTAPHNEFDTIHGKKCEFDPHMAKMGIRAPARYQGTLNHLSLYMSESFNEYNVKDKPPWIQELPLLNEEEIECLKIVHQERLGSIIAIDDLMGTVIESLKNKKILKNTIIIFTSDNGFSLDQHRVLGKRVPYEESVRVPLIIKDFSKKLPPIDERLIINTDLAPTILKIAGISSLETMDGRSILSNDKSLQEWRKHFLIEYWKDYIIPNVPSFVAVRSDSYLYVEYESGDREFYDLKNDPLELNNQINNEKCLQKINFLKQILAKLKNCSNGNCQIFENQDYTNR